MPYMRTTYIQLVIIMTLITVLTISPSLSQQPRSTEENIANKVQFIIDKIWITYGVDNELNIVNNLKW